MTISQNSMVGSHGKKVRAKRLMKHSLVLYNSAHKLTCMHDHVHRTDASHNMSQGIILTQKRGQNNPRAQSCRKGFKL